MCWLPRMVLAPTWRTPSSTCSRTSGRCGRAGHSRPSILRGTRHPRGRIRRRSPRVGDPHARRSRGRPDTRCQHPHSDRHGCRVPGARAFLQQSLRADFREALDPADPGFGLADLIAKRWGQVQKVRLLLLTDRKLSSRIDGKAAEDLGGVPIVHSVWDIGALADLVLAGRGSGEVEIDLAEFGGALWPCRRIERETTSRRT